MTTQQGDAASAERDPRLDSVTAVVLNYGTPELSLRACRALLADGLPPNRLVVVDNGSGDDSVAVFEAQLPSGAMIVAIAENRGVGGGMNAGAHALDGEQYLFLNNDAFVHRPGSLSAMLDAAADPSIGAVVPRVLNEDLSLQPSVVPPIDSVAVAVVRSSGIGRFVPNALQPRLSTYWDHSSDRNVMSAGGAVMMFRGVLWRSLHGFEESYGVFAEDHDAFIRTRAQGWRVRFTTEAEFVHLGNQTGQRAFDDVGRAERVARAEATLIRREAGRLRGDLAIGLMCLGWSGRRVLARARGRSEAATILAANIRGFRSGRHPAPPGPPAARADPTVRVVP